jgi:hypothetical protein
MHTAKALLEQRIKGEVDTREARNTHAPNPVGHGLYDEKVYPDGELQAAEPVAGLRNMEDKEKAADDLEACGTPEWETHQSYNRSQLYVAAMSRDMEAAEKLRVEMGLRQSS